MESQSSSTTSSENSRFLLRNIENTIGQSKMSTQKKLNKVKQFLDNNDLLKGQSVPC